MTARLTIREALFVREYLVDLNGKHAAIRAGYVERSAKVTASQLLTRPNLQAKLQEAINARVMRTNVTADRVLIEVARIAFSDIRALFDANGNVRPIHELSDDDAAVLAAVEVTGVKNRRG